MTKKKPKKWFEVYPVGTQAGDEEARLFRALARNPKYDWRSVGAIAKESKLDKERVEKILSKYHRKGIVFQNPANEDQWGYWERVPEMLPNNKKSVARQDQDNRIDNSIKSVDGCGFAPQTISFNTNTSCTWETSNGGHTFIINSTPNDIEKSFFYKIYPE